MMYCKLVILLFICASVESCEVSGQTIEEDIQTVINSPHGFGWASEKGDAALERIEASPSRYVTAIQKEIAFPDDAGLLSYPAVVHTQRYHGLLNILAFIGTEEALDVIEHVYHETAEDHTILNTQYRELLLPENKPSAATQEYLDLRNATATAYRLHIASMKTLGRLNDDRVLTDALARYKNEHYSVQPFIAQYSRMITGSFPLPNVTLDQ